jgi:hypothetical protein
MVGRRSALAPLAAPMAAATLGHVNTFCTPLFPDDVAAAASVPGGAGAGTTGEIGGRDR